MSTKCYSLYIVNKYGQISFNRDFSPGVVRLDTNETLRLASIWHSVHAISAQLSPVPGCEGIDVLEADTYEVHCFQTLTGTKFFLTTPPKTSGAHALLRAIYDLYADYVLKNPFYELEMPIRCELFDLGLQSLVIPA
mmetsp:Transcript_12877/g.42499  ORF Transcript_12877/g.42499 Transcript_12877/m.42499 type:complete len:137 (+) Transcript_12877:108-518(+)|eukprot:CAMPEP_0170144624 /NCGR_PEP_ID=MMETSP0033_2-20121228/14941_1 /TAXON_ID=195969 /ORGANISM="Dolichomastix tenuilepis, Strain CCMP3274" /LENGTH=136 /DNA_ID=CAMNT_0010381139 /DNA_START=109 /DNA_END=515 /DNA_ORIENTATION=+